MGLGMFNKAINKVGGEDSPLYLKSVFHWDASDASTVTTAATNKLVTIADKYGRGIDATAPTGKEPVYGLRTLNGLNVIDFDTSVRLGALVSNFGETITHPTTFIFVGKRDVFADYFFDGIDANRQLFAVSTGKDAVSAGAVLRGSTLSGDVKIYVVHFNGVNSFLYETGSKYTGNTGTRSISGITLGSAYNFVSSTFLNGFIAEKIMFDTLITDAEINEIGSDFSTKWNLTWTDL